MTEMPGSDLKYVAVFCFVLCLHSFKIYCTNQDGEFLANEVAIQPM